MNDKQEHKHIAIVGAGISGMTLAAILGRSSLGVEVTVYERDSPDRDQGTGFDISIAGQKVLKMAGVFDQYMNFSRSGSDLMRIYRNDSIIPSFVLCMPRFLRWFFPPTPESNRQMLRETLIQASTDHNVHVHFNTKANSIKEVENGKVELIGPEENVLGTYDLVIDASGFSSPLRQYRITPPEGSSTWEQSYTGISMIHGLVQDPEASCDKALVDLMGQGTMLSFAPGGGTFCFQRYGAAEEDHRASVYYMVLSETIGGLAERFDLPKNTRFHTDPEVLDKIKTWMREDMTKSNWTKEYLSCIDSLDQIALRPLFQHPPDPDFKKDSTLPLLLMGDALHVVPPYTGSGGNLALEDARDVANFFIKSKGCFSINQLRTLEQKLLNRAKPVMKDGDQTRTNILSLTNATTISDKDLVGGSTLIYLFGKLFTYYYRFECWIGLRKNNGRND